MDTVECDFIFSLSDTHCLHTTDSIFLHSSSSSESLKNCVMLVLSSDCEGKRKFEKEDQIESRCRSLIDVTIILLSTKTFMEWLHGQNEFAETVLRFSNILYSRDGGPTLPSLDSITPFIRSTESKQINLVHAKEFLVAAELFSMRNQQRIGLFMLHQVCELSLKAVIEFRTGLRVHTHNLKRLLNLTRLFTEDLVTIFFQKSELDESQFALLQRAYYEGRYGQLNGVTSSSFSGLFDKVEIVLSRILEINKMYLPSATK